MAFYSKQPNCGIDTKGFQNLCDTLLNDAYHMQYVTTFSVQLFTKSTGTS